MPTKNGRVRGASNELVAAARNLRASQTPAERVLWQALRGRQLDGFKFRRQYPVGNSVLDFVCVERKLVVELDGAHHSLDEYVRYDQARTEHLEQYGYSVVRFSNAAVLTDLDMVVEQIRSELAGRESSSE
ncbi:MAG: endonuclease domain-containing protein [Thermomicrobiales bacterium]|nr:endonuclease domain-containing protein [Thermomicrobiales bacterium]MCO5221518.1 endonuclease domain-containing protein [Thermomicrobiales bacterium]